ncbi:hypothetical protein O1611_g6115 [Lasiodiplodia mahajangana]|uniref:Uncharacterized protein n=1 Tax=Lasiodiplodia mahajangana TaxID=1108764 RepID=A0ACC2JJ27_9PEZI|nr:hypothetical protein O1611_g6115 [Lasiodiplodia mahajangana]
MESTLPEAPWAAARHVKSKRLPQVIGHRGYSAAFPENTMASFRGAIEVGATALEADLHLSQDGVVDSTLNRCFGQKKKISDCSWDHLSTLRTLREPSQPMPRLVDLLEYLNEPIAEHAWLLLDIKTDDDAGELLTAIAAAITSVPATKRPWTERVMLGPWDADWFGKCLRLLPDFPVALIAFSPDYASAMLPVPNLNFNLYNHSFATSRGSRFIARAQEKHRLLFSWSDNSDEQMSRSIRNEVDGVITDDPFRFAELCAQWDVKEVRERASQSTLKGTILWVIINVLVIVGEVISYCIGGSPRSRVSKSIGI